MFHLLCRKCRYAYEVSKSVWFKPGVNLLDKLRIKSYNEFQNN